VRGKRTGGRDLARDFHQRRSLGERATGGGVGRGPTQFRPKCAWRDVVMVQGTTCLRPSRQQRHHVAEYLHSVLHRSSAARIPRISPAAKFEDRPRRCTNWNKRLLRPEDRAVFPSERPLLALSGCSSTLPFRGSCIELRCRKETSGEVAAPKREMLGGKPCRMPARRGAMARNCSRSRTLGQWDRRLLGCQCCCVVSCWPFPFVEAHGGEEHATQREG